MIQISESKVTIRDLVRDYNNSQDNGVVAFSRLLDIRPSYQREFVYDDDKRDAVIRSISKGLPINVMYWGETTNSSNGCKYELIDGQQRTISICEYVKGHFSVSFDKASEPLMFTSLPTDLQDRLNDYELTVFKCVGTEEEKLEWFETINIAGEKLTKQELRNAVYTGMWLSSAKRYFSKPDCVALQLGKDYISGKPIRQEVLEEVLSWIADRDGFKKIEGYMDTHKRDENADELWGYFQDVIHWVKDIFGSVYNKDMHEVHWGILYNKYSKDFSCLNREELKNEVVRLHDDDEVTKKSGIYAYILSRDERYLSIRKFPDKIAQKVFNKQNGRCKFCGGLFSFSQMEADHIIPWSKGGHTDEGNCQMLCVQCNRSKSNKG